MSTEPRLQISSDDSVEKIVSDLESALLTFAASGKTSRCDFGLIELHPCHGLGYIHLTNGMMNDNYEPDQFDHKNVGWITLGDWEEAYSSQDGVMFIDGKPAGGIEGGDADVEAAFLRAIIPKLRQRIASSRFSVQVDAWGVTSGYSAAEAL